MGKETRHTTSPRKEPYQPVQRAESGDLIGSALGLGSKHAHGQHQSHYAQSTSSTYSSETARSSPPRVSPGSSPGRVASGSTPGSTAAQELPNPALWDLLRHGIVARTFGKDLARAFFAEIFSPGGDSPVPRAYRETDTAEYRHLDRAFFRKTATWVIEKGGDAEKTSATVDYAVDDKCGPIVRYNSDGGKWRPPQRFSRDGLRPGLWWFQGLEGGAGVPLKFCMNSELAYHNLRMPDGQRLTCKLSKVNHVNLRIKASVRTLLVESSICANTSHSGRATRTHYSRLPPWTRAVVNGTCTSSPRPLAWRSSAFSTTWLPTFRA